MKRLSPLHHLIEHRLVSLSGEVRNLHDLEFPFVMHVNTVVVCGPNSAKLGLPRNDAMWLGPVSVSLPTTKQATLRTLACTN